jgi:ketosteroid isomerase-like protein
MANTDSHLRAVDAFNARDWNSLAADLAEDCELIDHARGFTAKGREQWLEAEKGWAAGFSDAHVTDTRLIDGGDATVLLFTAVGTNDGPLGPLAATGRSVHLPFSEVRYWDAGGKTTRAEWYYDQVGMLVQLGHMPPPEG